MTPVRKRSINPNSAANLQTGEAMRGIRRPPEPLRSDEIASLLSAAAFNAKPAALSARNQALIIVWWRAGLRLSESLALRPTDVDVRGGTILVRNGKGDKTRTVGIDGPSAIILSKWMDVREKELVQPKNRGPLFCSTNGAPMTKAGAQNMLKRAARRAELGDRRVHPHALRHSMACELVRENVPIAFVQQQLGHSRLDTTATYLVGLNPQETVDRMHNRTWTPEALAALTPES
jgi:site-specific recombinase XerD